MSLISNVDATYAEAVQDLELHVANANAKQLAMCDRGVLDKLGSDEDDMRQKAIQECEELLLDAERVFTQYMQIMRTYPDEAVDGISSTPDRHWKELDCLRLWHRDLVYAKGPPLSEEDEYFNVAGQPHASFMLTQARNYMAYRISRVEALKNEGKDPYVCDGAQDDQPPWTETDKPGKLSPETEWLIDQLRLLPLEIQTLVLLALMANQAYKPLKAYAARKDELSDDAEQFRDYTEEAMGLKETTCSICYSDLGPVYSEENAVGPAVRFNCGHIFGKKCIEKWVGEHETCSLCRDQAGSRKLRLERLLAIAPGWIQDWREIGREIDAYFLEGEPQHMYGSRMHSTYRRIVDLVTVITPFVDSMYELLRT